MRIKNRAEQQSVRFLLFNTDSAKLNDARIKRANAICTSIYFRYNKMFGFGNKYKKICKGGMTMPPLQGQWYEALKPEFGKEYYRKLFTTIGQEYKTYKVFPAPDDIFNAFHFTPLDRVKVVILGQDPYHNDGQAHGLCFSVKPEVEVPPSLVNIYQELHDDCGCYIPNNGYLEKWAKQGVLMLNTVLTVRAHQANSHKGIGWEEFTDAAIRILNKIDHPMVFLLWGRPAQMKKSMLNNPKHLILEAPHPSPLSAYRGFFGCHHFSQTNEFLIQHGIEPIDWQIENR